MLELGNTVLKSVKERIHKGLDVNEQYAKPLKPTTHVDKSGALADLVPYPVQKQRKGRQPIRDLTMTGALMNSVQVILASDDRCVIASNNAVKDKVLHKNNLRSPQFGLSNTDHQVMEKKVGELLRKKMRVETS